MDVVGADFVAVTQCMEAGVVDVVPVHFYYSEVLLVSVLFGQRTILRHDHVHRYGLLEPVVSHGEEVVPASRYSAAFTFLGWRHTRQHVTRSTCFEAGL